MTPCFVGLYDMFRAWANPKSISNAPWSAPKNVHDYYYQKFLVKK